MVRERVLDFRNRLKLRVILLGTMQNRLSKNCTICRLKKQRQRSSVSVHFVTDDGIKMATQRAEYFRRRNPHLFSGENLSMAYRSIVLGIVDAYWLRNLSNVGMCFFPISRSIHPVALCIRSSLSESNNWQIFKVSSNSSRTIKG